MNRASLWSLVTLMAFPAVRAQEQRPSTKVTEEKQSVETTTFDGKLTADDPKHKVTKGPHKVHTVQLSAGKTYQIDMVPRQEFFPCALLLEGASGKQLTNSRILFEVPKTDTYRVIATSLGGGMGSYRLTVKEASASAAASVRALIPLDKDFNQRFTRSCEQLYKDYAHAQTEAERSKLLDVFTTHWKQFEDALAKIAKDAAGEGAGPNAERMARTVRDSVAYEKGHIAISAGGILQEDHEHAVEAQDKKADELYRKAENYLAEGARKYAHDAALASEFKDQLYRLQHLSVGKTAPEIEGEDLDGKKFKLSDYRGKVVVLSFWAFW